MNETPLTLVRKIKLRFVILGFVIVALLYLAFNYAVLYVSVELPANLPKVTDFDQIDHHHHDDQPQATAGSAEEVDFRENIIKDSDKVEAQPEVSVVHDSNTQLLGKPGLHFVKRTATAATVQVGNTSTSSAFFVPWYGFIYKNIDIKLDTNADKLAYKSTLRDSCGVYSERLQQMVQFACTDPRALSIFTTPSDSSWMVQNIADLSYERSAYAPYRGGLIGISTQDGATIKVTSDEGAVSSYSLPDTVGCFLATCLEGDTAEARSAAVRNYPAAQIFTDTKDQTNDKFLLVTSQGTIYLAKPQGDQVEYRKITPSKDYDTLSYQTLCDINDSQVYCYRGLASNPSSGQVSSKDTPSQLLAFNFNTSDQSVIDLRDNLALNFLGVTTSGKLFVKEGNSLIHLQIDGQKAREIAVARGVDKVSTGEDAYYTYNKAVFRVDSQTLTAHRVFHSDHIAPEKIITSKESVVILGRAPQNQSTTTYAWKLNSEENLSPGLRVIDRLPSAPGSIAFSTTDLVGDKIYIQVPMDRGSPASHIKDTQERVLRNLKTSGIDTSKLEVITPGL